MGQIFCTQCGTANDETNNYCINCQSQLRKIQKEVVAQPVQTSSNYNRPNNSNNNTAQTNYNNQYKQQLEKPVTMGTWIGLMLLSIVPFGGIIALIIALSSQNQSLKNYGKAMLVIMGIGFVLAILAIIVVAVFVDSFGTPNFYW